MHIDTILSSASNADEGNHLREFDYINVVGGSAFLFAVVVFFVTLFSCCKSYTIEQDRSQNPSNVVTEADNDRPVVTALHRVGTEHRCSSERSMCTSSSSSATQKGRSTDTIPLLTISTFSKPRGLVNNRNTCYFNSVMQALAQTTILKKQLDKIRNLGDMVKEFTQFYASMHGSETSAFDPQRLQRLMSHRTGKFNFGIQHDSHECLLNILHELKKDEKQGRGELLTVVDKIFGGHTMTVYTCEVCHTPTHLCEPFLDISLPIPNSRKSSAKRARSAVQKDRSRPLPPLDGVQHGIPQQQWVSKHYTAEMEVGFDSKEEEQRGRKRKKRADDRSRERSAGSKLEKREDEVTRFTTPELTPRAASNEPDPTAVEQNDYNEAVRCMMTTLSIGREPTNLCTLEDCLRCYTRKERIVGEYLCRECNSQSETDADIRQTSATKQTLIFNAPAVLTFHLKRFENKSRVYVKRNTMVYYEDVLDIGPYYTGWWKGDQSQNVWYSLYAVVVHSGTLQSGHYIAYVKAREFDQKIAQFLQKSYLNRDDITVERLVDRMHNRISQKYRPTPMACKKGTWYCVNDRAVTEVSAQEALSQEAFLLFYERL